MNAKISVLVICVEAIIYLLLHNLQDCTFKFTNASDKESIAFLDIKVSLRNGKVFTEVYLKSTDRHQYHSSSILH